MFQSLVCSALLLQKVGLLDERVPAYQECCTSLMLARWGYFVHTKEALFVYYFGVSDSIFYDKRRDKAGRDYSDYIP